MAKLRRGRERPRGCQHTRPPSRGVGRAEGTSQPIPIQPGERWDRLLWDAEVGKEVWVPPRSVLSPPSRATLGFNTEPAPEFTFLESILTKNLGITSSGNAVTFAQLQGASHGMPSPIPFLPDHRKAPKQGLGDRSRLCRDLATSFPPTWNSSSSGAAPEVTETLGSSARGSRRKCQIN